ncbi:TetR family transcriptional regulator, partial [Streptomyces sp. SID8455]|nr:TetR family transcriptional regulator [Streptomyces sp. SID8455]
QLRPDADPRIALELLIAPLTHRWLLRTLPLTHAYADTIVDYALGGLAPRP